MKVSQECLQEKDFININRPNRSFFVVYFVFFKNKKTNRVNVSVDSNVMTVIKDVVLKAMWIDSDADFVTVTFSSSQGESIKIKFVKGSTL